MVWSKKRKMIYAISGHRPDRIPDFESVERRLARTFVDLRVDRIVQGMAPGVDLSAASIAYQLDIPFTAVIPWAGHRDTIPRDWLRAYDLARVRADDVIILDPEKEYGGPRVFHARNRWMVDHSDGLVSVWDGGRKGGTYSTVLYAQRQGRAVINIDPSTEDTEWLL